MQKESSPRSFKERVQALNSTRYTGTDVRAQSGGEVQKCASDAWQSQWNQGWHSQWNQGWHSQWNQGSAWTDKTEQ